MTEENDNNKTTIRELAKFLVSKDYNKLNFSNSLPEIVKSFSKLENLLGNDSMILKSIEDITTTQKTLEKLAKASEINSFSNNYLKNINITKTENPINETNKKLANIENKFNDIHKIAIENAKIANSLNMSAAEFLTRFENTSKDNQKFARRTIIFAGIAIFATLISPFMPTIIDYIMKLF